MEDKITIEHGSGARKTRDLISEFFVGKFNSERRVDEDAALIFNDKLAFSTDSFIIEPEVFRGGNIGKLAVCGTANDLAVRGARPKWMSASYVIAEGYSMEKLRVISESMADTARKAGIAIVTGDTKVIGKEDFKGVIINTSGVGEVVNATSIADVRCDDVIIITGSLGDHSAAILSEREGIYLESPIESDCAVLYPMLENIIRSNDCRFIRDITRGGLTSILYEVQIATGYGVEVEEVKIPVKPAVREICELMGMDFMGMANEGKALLCVNPDKVTTVLAKLRMSELGRDAAVIGRITGEHDKVLLVKEDGQAIAMDETTNIPRIC